MVNGSFRPWPRPPPTPILLFVGFALLFLGLRSLPLRYDALLGTTEQHEFGLFAEHLVAGLLGPPSAYLPEPHQSCTVFFGVFCAPLEWVLGPSLGTLRRCALLLHALGAAAAVVALHRAGGRGVAVVGGLLLLLGPPKAIHYAHKGSTNHDDAAWILCFALIPAATPGALGVRQLAGLGFSVGVAVAYYIDAAAAGLALLAVVAVDLAKSLGRASVRPLATLLVATGTGLGTLALTGAQPWRSGGIARAVEGTGGVGFDERLIRLGQAMVGMWDFPRRVPWGAGLLPGEGWAGPLYVATLVLLAVLPPARPAAFRFRLAVWSMAALNLVGVGLLAADARLPGYLMPGWTWLVCAAAVGGPGFGAAASSPAGTADGRERPEFRPLHRHPWPQASRWLRAVPWVRAAAAGGALAVCVLAPSWSGPIRCQLGLEPGDRCATERSVAALTDGLRGSRLARSALGRALTSSVAPATFLSWQRPAERLDLLRLAGAAAAQTSGPAAAALPEVPPAERHEVERGFGCAQAGWERGWLLDGAFVFSRAAGWAWCRAGGGPPDLVRGLAEAPALPPDALCVGLGHRAWEGARLDWFARAREAPLRCSAAAFAAGWAEGLRTDASGRILDVAIDPWWPDAPAPARRAFGCVLAGNTAESCLRRARP